MSNKVLPNGNRYLISHVEDIDNVAILEKFLQLRDDQDTRKTHLFDGRYENIYISRDRLPELEPVFRLLEQTVLDMTGCDRDKLKLGFWLNAMEPGQKTTLHSHDNWDEVLSAVYYVAVPARSGYLVISEGAERIAVQPRAGRIVMFSPKIDHEVTENRADAMRLSVGINVGVEEED